MIDKSRYIALGAKCDECPLRDRPATRSFGPPIEEAVAVIVGEAPGNEEAQRGIPFVGQSGQLLRAVAQHVGLDMEKVYLTNVVMCHPLNNDLPKDAISCCGARLLNEIMSYSFTNRPIGAAGATAAQLITGNKRKIGELRGTWYEDRILPMWHPAYVLRFPGALSQFVADMKKLAHGGPARMPEPVYKVVESAVELLDKLYTAGTVVCDIEASGLDYQKSEILSIGFAASPKEAYIIPRDLLGLQITTNVLRQLFDMSQLKIVGHNFKFDMRFLKHQLGIDNVRVDYDTMIAHYVLDENSAHGLKELVSLYFDVRDYEARLIKRHLGRSTDYSNVPLEDLYQYNACDVCYNFALWKELERELKEENLFEHPFLHPLMALNEPLLESELHGVLVDRDALEPLQKQVHLTIASMQRKLEEMAGTPFNPNSPKQVSKIMYETFGMPLVRGRRFGERSTSEGARIAIKKLIAQDSDAYRWVDSYDKLKKVEKMRSSYVDNLPKHIGSDGRVHPSFKIHGTVVGRLSASDPAIQTIPRSTSTEVGGVRWGKLVRSLFIAPPGKVLLQADYSQAEIRCAAVCSGDPYLIHAYNEDRDIHSEVACGIYGDGFTKEQRSITKNFMFSYIYGGTEYSFAKDSDMPLEKAREFVRRFNALMPVLCLWREDQKTLMSTQGYVTTSTGRRRRFPIITRTNAEEAMKQAIHFPIAGLAAEIMLQAVIRLDFFLRFHPDTKLLFTVHDSAIFEVPIEHTEWLALGAKGIMEEMATRIAPQVKWKVDIEVGPSWGELEKYEC